MRWLSFFILLYVAIGIQIGLGGYVNIGQAQPSFPLLAAVFIAMNAPRDMALIGCFILGFAQDLLTISPLGLYALQTSLVGLLVSSTQEIVDRNHFLSHTFMGFFGAMLAAMVTLLHSALYPLFHTDPATHQALHTPRPSITALLGGALFTGLLAPIVIGLLQRMKKGFGFRGGRTPRKGW